MQLRSAIPKRPRIQNLTLVYLHVVELKSGGIDSRPELRCIINAKWKAIQKEINYIFNSNLHLSQ